MDVHKTLVHDLLLLENQLLLFVFSKLITMNKVTTQQYNITHLPPKILLVLKVISVNQLLKIQSIILSIYLV